VAFSKLSGAPGLIPGMTKSHWVPTILATTAAALLLAACGGNPAGDGASAGQPDDTKRLAFNACLRKAGLTVIEHTGADRGIEVRIPRSISRARMATIEQDCARKTGGGPGSGPQLSTEQQAAMLDQALKFARCMRAHGVAMADPKLERNGLRMDGPGKRDSPAVKRAQAACAALMPRKPGDPRGANTAAKGSK
jgi:hypothetical protein